MVSEWIDEKHQRYIFLRDNGEKIPFCVGVSDDGNFGVWQEKTRNPLTFSVFNAIESVRFANFMAFLWMIFAQTMQDGLENTHGKL